MLTAINNYVLIKPEETPKTVGGLVLPKNTVSMIRRGTAISVAKNILSSILVEGTTIYFPTIEAQPIIIDDVQYFLIESKYIYGVEV